MTHTETRIEHTRPTANAAYLARRALIQRSVRVSLITFDPSRGVYVFDAWNTQR